MATQLREGPGAVEAERQIVALHLGDEIYGVDIATIHTVITPHTITSVPRTPPFVAGVMNLRGRIVPVVDLRRRFGLPPLAEGHVKSQRIVIVDVQGLTAGLVVDAVSEVLRLPESAIDPPSRLVASAEADCILGIGRIPGTNRRDGDPKDGKDGEERLIVLLDVYQTLVTAPGDADALQDLQRAA